MGLGSGIRKNIFRIPNPGSKRHRIPDPEPQNYLEVLIPTALWQELPATFFRCLYKEAI
jgi:hypothetical protein